MALIKEDGTGLANANAYQNVTDFKAYWNEVGYAIAGTDQQIEYALILATRYLETRFARLWYGYRLTDTQSLSWPRNCVLDPLHPYTYLTGVPIQVQKATNEYARRSLSNGVDALLPDPADTDASGQVIKRKSVAAGPIKKDIEYASAGAVLLKDFPAADLWLTDLMADPGGCIRA